MKPTVRIKIGRARRIRTAAAALVLSATAITGCATSDATTTTGDPATLRYQSAPGLMNYAELADALGYLDGITLDNVGQVQGGPDMLRAMATNQTDFATGPFHGAIAKLVAADVDVSAVVASYGSSRNTRMSLLVPEGSDIQDGADLIGATIGVNTLGANSEAVIDTYLEREGLSDDEISDVTLVPLPSVNLEAALREGQIDAALMSFSAKENALANGGVRSLVDDTDLVGSYNGGSYVLHDRYIAEHPDLARRFVGGVAKAIEYDRKHSRDEVMKVYGAWLRDHGRADELEAFRLWKSNGIATRGGVLRDEDFSLWLDWLEARGEVETGAIDVPDLYTNEFNPYATRSDR